MVIWASHNWNLEELGYIQLQTIYRRKPNTTFSVTPKEKKLLKNT